MALVVCWLCISVTTSGPFWALEVSMLYSKCGDMTQPASLSPPFFSKEFSISSHSHSQTHISEKMSRTSNSASRLSPRSLEACTSMNPDDYKWGAVAPQQQAAMNAQFAHMSFFAAFSFPPPPMTMSFPGCIPPPWMKPAHAQPQATGEPGAGNMSDSTKTAWDLEPSTDSFCHIALPSPTQL